MTVIRVHRYVRSDLQLNPSVLFVFGDNMATIGYGGQAREARGEPNAVGIPTLWAPRKFFCDADLENEDVVSAIVSAFHMIREHLKNGGIVILPADGVGTGLADLPRKSPKIHDFIQRHWSALK